MNEINVVERGLREAARRVHSRDVSLAAAFLMSADIIANHIRSKQTPLDWRLAKCSTTRLETTMKVDRIGAYP